MKKTLQIFISIFFIEFGAIVFGEITNDFNNQVLVANIPEEEDPPPPDDDPFVQSPSPGDSIIFLPNGEPIIISGE